SRAGRRGLGRPGPVFSIDRSCAVPDHEPGITRGAMPSERVQRQIDRLLDEAEAALGRREWPRVHELSQDALALDPENSDARTFLDAAVRPGAGAPTKPVSRPAAAETQSPPLPASFAAGRYTVRR